MDTSTRKLDLIRGLIQLSDEKILSKIKALQEENTDFWNELNEPQRQEIKKSLAELEAGQRHDYESVVARHR